jgi:hypothetical protein
VTKLLSSHCLPRRVAFDLWGACEGTCVRGLAGACGWQLQWHGDAGVGVPCVLEVGLVTVDELLAGVGGRKTVPQALLCWNEMSLLRMSWPLCQSDYLSAQE